MSVPARPDLTELERLLGDALDMAYDPPSEAHSALDALLAEAQQVETLRVGLRRIAEFGEERSFSIPADQMACLARATLEGASDE